MTSTGSTAILARAARPASTAFLLLLAALAARPARAAERMAVLVLAASDKEAELADNVTEVVIGFVARRTGAQVAGKEELRGRLGVTGERQAAACLDDLSCLARAGVSLGVRRIVAGHVGARGSQYLFNLTLNDLESSQVTRRVFRLVDGGVEDLVRAVEDASAELFRPRVEPGRIQIRSEPVGARVSIDHAYLGITPLVSGTLLPGRHQVRVEAQGRFPWLSDVEVLPGQDLGITLGPSNLPNRRRWPATVAYGSAALGGLSLAAGGFLGVLSQLSPTGVTRADVQRDMDQKHRLAMGANGAFIAGGVLVLVSLYHFLHYGADIFGAPAEP
jgi:PEGA domain